MCVGVSRILRSLSGSGDLLPVSFSSVPVFVCVQCVLRTW